MGGGGGSKVTELVVRPLPQSGSENFTGLVSLNGISDLSKCIR
jgi:hypothetical protein